jgi:two-component system chemotaxis response regulator CheB
MREAQHPGHGKPGRGHDIVVVGGSAGSLDVIRALLSGLPEDLPAAVFVVIHVSPHGPSMMPQILQKATRLKVAEAVDGAPIEPGRVYVAAKDHHLLVENGRVRVVRGPLENRHRPAVDPLFRSAAWAHGPHVVAIVVSGALDDGAAGLWAVKTCGGVTVVQDPAEAPVPDMPKAALATVPVDHCLPVAQIAGLVVGLARDPVESTEIHRPEKLGVELGFMDMERDTRDMDKLGTPSGFVCPSCHGALWELHEAELLRYRCHVGHAFSADSLLAELTCGIEDALYSAVRALREKAASARRIGERMGSRMPLQQDRYEKMATELEESASTISSILVSRTREKIWDSNPPASDIEGRGAGDSSSGAGDGPPESRRRRAGNSSPESRQRRAGNSSPESRQRRAGDGPPESKRLK